MFRAKLGPKLMALSQLSILANNALSYRQQKNPDNHPDFFTDKIIQFFINIGSTFQSP
ncbi:hypothetical protein Awo_c33530 [Acetobacterium woodii DSM 1030]|uniref:Uncharacterized protein n=1 Tax=Acetobacterium woodii (strain ATCC 29683 / DSM 1030 / JCM 2381 / KCTC 1655 / WB1) TaxID=931626 RepID=H6LKX2_ACEWD|nr:hypothetical protein Awo_c33530 [Acetobacterium woodii DSM 1030]